MKISNGHNSLTSPRIKILGLEESSPQANSIHLVLAVYKISQPTVFFFYFYFFVVGLIESKDKNLPVHNLFHQMS
jgi:hypothetical protein